MHYVLFLSWLHVSQHSSGAHWRRQVVHHRPASKIPESLVAGHYALRCWIGWTCRAALRTKGRSSRRSRIPPRRRRRQSLLNPSSEPIPDSPAAQYAVGSALARRASDTNFDRICRYLVRMPTEFRVLGVCVMPSSAIRRSATSPVTLLGLFRSTRCWLKQGPEIARIQLYTKHIIEADRFPGGCESRPKLCKLE